MGINMKIYFAGPLYSEDERDWIRATISKVESLAAQRGTKTGIIFPYDLISLEEIDRLGEHAKVEIFSRCKSHLDDADLMIALSTALRWTTKLHGRPDIFAPENHPNRKLSESELISGERGRAAGRR